MKVSLALRLIRQRLGGSVLLRQPPREANQHSMALTPKRGYVHDDGSFITVGIGIFLRTCRFSSLIFPVITWLWR